MYHHQHHRLWNCMSNSSILGKGLMFGGYRLPIASPSYTLQTSSFLRSRVVVVVPTNRWLSSSTTTTFSSSSSGSMGMMTKGFPRIPLLCLSPTSDGRILPAFDPSGRCFYDIPIPKEVQGPNNSVRGAGHGWLVMVKSNKQFDDYGVGEPEEMILSLYNPITRAHIPLPSIQPPSIVGDAQVWCNPTKASPGQPLVSIILGRRILIYEQGDDDWSREIVTPLEDRMASTVYHEAEAALYVVFWDGRLSVLDLASWTLRPLINTPSPEIETLSRSSRRLVVGAAGNLLLVVGAWLKYERPHVDVFELDRRCLKWARTTNIGDHTLFMYENNSRVVSMVCDQGFTDAQASQIYLFKQYRTGPVGNRQVQETDTELMIEMPADVQVWDLTAAAAAAAAGDAVPTDQKEQLFFSTSNILRGPRFCWYQQFAAWIVPSLS